MELAAPSNGFGAILRPRDAWDQLAVRIFWIGAKLIFGEIGMTIRIEISLGIANGVELLSFVIELIAIPINRMAQPTAEHRDRDQYQTRGTE
jgi:hypothetical protein